MALTSGTPHEGPDSRLGQDEAFSSFYKAAHSIVDLVESGDFSNALSLTESSGIPYSKALHYVESFQNNPQLGENNG